MSDITKIKVDGEPESSYKLFPKNREFEKRAGGNTGSQSGVQSDWNQNDETQPDYVKNRPFYTGDPVETVFVEESTVSFAPADGVYMGELQSTFSATVGETYKVSWDGTTYESACVEYKGDIFIGNLSIMGTGPDTGEPFLIGVFNGEGIQIGTTDTSASHTISISGFVQELVKIDEKYLPELPYIDKVNPTGTGAFSLNRKADTMIGNYSFAEGISTTASGHYSHAEGNNTSADGMTSHAEGDNTIASGDYSHAEGFYTNASGHYSHAEGCGTEASSKYQHVHGKYNIKDTSNTYAEIVGNGERLKNSNAHTLDWSGVPWFKGRPQFGGTAQDQDSQTVMANGDKEIILASSSSSSTKKFKITVDDSGALTATEVT